MSTESRQFKLDGTPHSAYSSHHTKIGSIVNALQLCYLLTVSQK